MKKGTIVAFEDIEEMFGRLAAKSNKVRFVNSSKNFDDLSMDIGKASAAPNICALYKNRYDTAIFYVNEKFLRVFPTLKEVAKVEKTCGGKYTLTEFY